MSLIVPQLDMPRLADIHGGLRVSEEKWRKSGWWGLGRVEVGGEEERETVVWM